MINVLSDQILNQIKKGFDMSLLETLGGRIMMARRSNGLTAEELIGRLNREKNIEITNAHMSRIEHNKGRPSLDLVVAIADILDESVDYLH